MSERPRNVQDIAAQRADIKRIGDLATYTDFEKSHFVDARWPEMLQQDIAEERIQASSDYFRFLGLVGIVCAQYGFKSLDGQIIRHARKGWQKPVTSPRHQLAVASYTAELNLQRRPLIEARLPQLDTDTAKFGAYGLMYDASDGNVIPIEESAEEFRDLAEARANEARKICLPDIPLNTQLADLHFTGDAAEQMPREEFEERIFPRVQEIAGDLFDAEVVFLETPEPGSSPLFIPIHER